MTASNLRTEVFAAVQSYHRDTSYNWQDSERAASLIAQGVERGNAALQSELTQIGRSLGTNITAVATLLERDLGLIAAEVAELSKTTASIEDALRNPRSTSAAEAFRRGIYALQNDWLEDSLDELSQSVSDDRYFAPAHAYTGLVKLRLGRTSEAIPDLRLAVKYGTRHFPAIAAGAALLGARTSVDLGDIQAGLEILAATQDIHSVCPELVVMMAKLGGDITHLDLALRAAPELAAIFSTPHAEGVKQVIQGVCDAVDGPVAETRLAAKEMKLVLEHVTPVSPADGEHLLFISRESQTATERMDEADGALRLLAAADLLHFYREHAELPLALAEHWANGATSRRLQLQAEVDRLTAELSAPDRSGDPIATVKEKIQKAKALKEMKDSLAAIEAPTWLLPSVWTIREAIRPAERISPWSE